MANQVPYKLAVANSNPTSRFSHFSIVSVIEVADPRSDETEIEIIDDLATLEEHPYDYSAPFYMLYGVYAAGAFTGPTHRPIRSFDSLDDAKEFLVELNGPSPEDHE